LPAGFAVKGKKIVDSLSSTVIGLMFLNSTECWKELVLAQKKNTIIKNKYS